ncbi:hypothetical protein [Catelliglobosispora koreensis]|uniref:hypothetical protein n=1 Tax=Catelliglobosispora koreensis TaxID=129052 RepID=UPI0003698593|nr:hypothetical protein [Catelliglobosispora koreensis]
MSFRRALVCAFIAAISIGLLWLHSLITDPHNWCHRQGGNIAQLGPTAFACLIEDGRVIQP